MAQIHRAVGLGVDKILNHLLRPDAAADRGPLSLAGELHRPHQFSDIRKTANVSP